MGCGNMFITALDGHTDFYRFLAGAQIYKRSGIEEWRQAMLAKGPEFQSAVNWMSYQLVRDAFILMQWQ